ncbi:MAG: hypothetical protein ABIH25_03060 [Candidatus Woesearchaeota archaeon]
MESKYAKLVREKFFKKSIDDVISSQIGFIISPCEDMVNKVLKACLRTRKIAISSMNEYDLCIQIITEIEDHYIIKKAFQLAEGHQRTSEDILFLFKYFFRENRIELLSHIASYTNNFESSFKEGPTTEHFDYCREAVIGALGDQKINFINDKDQDERALRYILEYSPLKVILDLS